MLSTSSRLLRLISLLSTRPSWTAGELAERMDVTERTVRRDIAKLRELGYGVDSDPGPWGGYRLGQGSAAVPLVLDDEESLAVAVALREAAQTGVLGDDQAALSALLKLRQLLPSRVAKRLGAMDAIFERTSAPKEPPLSPGMLATLANVCRRSERTRMSYRDAQGAQTVRDVDPHRLVFTGHRWYLVAHDVAQGAWRTFRADRVVEARPTGRIVRLDDRPGAAELVARMITSDYPVYAVARIRLPLAEAMRLVPPTAGTHRPEGPTSTIVTIGGRDADSLADFLIRLATPLQVISPNAVRNALWRKADALAAANQPD